ncbi:MAG TPA: biopolymer transporter ExbD [Opitutaceae bacterium]|nr:biopolymer transporter ExbD [Opitutaceae bacterium]
MARTFRRQRVSHPIAELNVTNLIDLGFLLLIIFMITTSSSKEEQTIPIHLPEQSKQMQPKTEDTRFVAVSVDARGQYYIDNRPVDLADLRQRLKSMGEDPKPPVIRVRGDGAVTYDKIIGLVDEIQRANLHQLTFDTQIKP